MEDWQSKVQKDVQVESGSRSSQIVVSRNLTTTPEDIEDELEEERNRIEDEVRRQEVKRKTAPGGRKPKRRNREKLVGWGEPQTEADNFEIGSVQRTNIFEVGLGLGVGNMHINPSLTQRPDVNFGVVSTHEVGNLEQNHGLDWMKGVEQRIDVDIRKQIQEPSMAKVKISEKVRKQKFKFYKRGKLKKEEIVELTRTNKNMFDWVKVVPSVMVAEKELEDDGQDDWLIEIMKKEERLARMETRRKEWEAGYICKEIMRDIMESVSKSEGEKRIQNLLDMVVDTAVHESKVKAILADIKEYKLENIIMETVSKSENEKKVRNISDMVVDRRAG